MNLLNFIDLLGGGFMSDYRKIKKEFEIKPSQEAYIIAEAFGIESGYVNKVLNIEIPNNLPQVTYITGESGCGKTTLLKELGYSKRKSMIKIPDKPLFKWGDDVQKTLKLLSLVGLSDAIHFVSYYDELSDSQQYRARLFLHLLQDNDLIILDEFLSTLDRETAKAVAYMFQKVIRKLDKKVVLATAHNDLFKYLQPDLLIEGKSYPSRWEVEEYKRDKIINLFVDNIEIREEDKEWYRECRLGELHYKGKYTGGVKDYLGAYYNNKLVGLLIGTYRMWDGGRRISRLVVHPSYRSLGIGSYIVEKYLDMYPDADVVATMARFNKVFERAGMKKVEDSVSKPPSGLKSKLNNKGFDKDRWFKKSYCVEFMGDKENRKVLLDFVKEINYLITPGGKSLSDEEIKGKIIMDKQTAGRVLWNLRPKRMAKYVGRKDK